MDPYEMSGRAADLDVVDDVVDEETSFTNVDTAGAVLPDPPVGTPTQQLGGHGDSLQNLRDELRASELNEKKQRLVDAYYEEVGREYGSLSPPTKIPYDQFTISDDGKTLYWTPGNSGKEVRVTATRGGAQFRGLSTLAQEYGNGGTDAIRKSLGLQKYTYKTRKGGLSANGEAALGKEAQKLSKSADPPTGGENIPLQDFSRVANDAIESTKMATAILTEELSREELTPEQEAALETINDPPLDTEWMGRARRELAGLGKAMTRNRDELVNNLAKLSELDRDIQKKKERLDYERRKLTETAGSERLIQEIENRITTLERELADLQSEREARLEAAGAIRETFRSQISRVRETIDRILHEDKTLAERIRTLFREQGITIASILTAIGMAISTLVLALTGGGGGAAPTPPAPPDKGGLREWAKKTLRALGRVLAKLAGKAAAALPGIIGSVVSWLLSAAGKAAGWLATNLWAVLVAVGGLLLVAAREWLAPKKPKRE